MFYLSRKDHDILLVENKGFFRFLMALPHHWALSGPYWDEDDFTIPINTIESIGQIQVIQRFNQERE